ncbi:MAG: response regulator [Anaerolineae bacterium]|nr:response regulator [Anaerolineae bacterium]
MNESTSGVDLDLRVSPKTILIALVVLGALLYFGVTLLSASWEIEGGVMTFFLSLCAIGIAGWLLVNWKPLVGRWFTILALSAAVHLAGLWLGIPGSLAWAALPIAFAVPLVGLSAASVAAVGESAIVLYLAERTGGDSSSAVIAMVVIWGVFVALCAMQYRIRQHHVWLTEYFEHAQQFLEEARDHRADLEQALDDLAHANRQLTLMNERVTVLRLIAEEAQKAKTRFVARVSHEFRTPLNMIIGLVDLMTETPEIYDVTPSPRMREALQVVHRNCQHLSDMVSDVLDLTRIETDRMVLHRERIDIGGVIDSTVETVRALMESKHLALELTVAEEIPEVYCDRTRIEQVILNLMSNAARYTDEGKITVAVVRQDQRIQVSVTDTGPGIPPQDLERIFEPFCQGTSDFWRDKGGSGLGLSISKQFVEMHGGRMWVESELGVGTTFAFELPISPPIALTGKPGHQIREDWIWYRRQSRPDLPDSHYSPRLVICDETGDLYTMLSRYSEEIEFVEAHGEAEAIKALQQAPAHAILLNAIAPENLLPQVEMLRRESAGTPIIGCSVPRSAERARSLGVSGYLIKPIARADLKQALHATGHPVKHVLAVDDDPEAVQLVSQMLLVCDGDLEVTTACSGEEVLDRLRSNPPDLMLLDIVMPGMDGWQVLEYVTSHEEIPSVPTFFVSGQDPRDQPPRSDFLLAAVDGGLSLNNLLRCSLEISNLLLQPEEALGPALERTGEGAPVLPGSPQPQGIAPGPPPG